MGIHLDEDERWEMLDSHDIMRLATRDPDGHPHVIPVWFVADADEGSIYFATPGRSRKKRNLDEDPRMSLTVDGGGSEYFELRAVVVHGTAEPVTDETERASVERQWAEKYFERSEVPEFMRHFFDGDLRWYRIEPSSWSSWDNSRIDTDRLG